MAPRAVVTIRILANSVMTLENASCHEDGNAGGESHTQDGRHVGDTHGDGSTSDLSIRSRHSHGDQALERVRQRPRHRIRQRLDRGERRTSKATQDDGPSLYRVERSLPQLRRPSELRRRSPT